MWYVPPWQQRPQRPSQPEPGHVPAAIAMLSAAKFADLPFGGYAGELAAPGPPPPVPTIVFGTGLEIPPPDWEAEEAERREREGDQVEPEPSVPFTPEAPPWTSRFDWAPPAPAHEPLTRVRIPEPDWRAEERQRADTEARQRSQRERHEKLLELLEEEGT